MGLRHLGTTVNNIIHNVVLEDRQERLQSPPNIFYQAINAGLAVI